MRFGQSLFVWAIWLGLLIILLACIALYGRNIPLAEDWNLVPPFTGHEPDIWSWLWSQNNEHRLPLQRLVMLGLLQLTGDFRAGMVASVVLIALMCAALIWAAMQQRGGAIRWTDAFFPLLLLNLGHWENFVWGWQLQFTISIALTIALLIVILRSHSPRRASWLALGSVVLILLPLTGANGLITTLAVAPWALFVGFRSVWDKSAPASVGAHERLLGGAALVAIGLVALYFVGYDSPDWTPANPGIVGTLAAAAKIAAMGLVPAASVSWASFAALALLVLAASALLVLRAAALAWMGKRHEERERALGVLGFGAGALVLMAAIGYGRAGYEGNAFPYRYALLVAPAFCLAYFVWQVHGSRIGSWAQAALLGITLLALPLNVHKGLGWRDWYVSGMEAVERDIAAGRSASEIAADHRAFLMHWNEGLLSDRIRMLEQAGTGPFGTRLRASRPETTGV